MAFYWFREVLHSPGTPENGDVPGFVDGLGLGANDPEAVREVMRQLALNRYPAATIRFAQRLALRSEDAEAEAVLRALRRGAAVDRVTTPVEHDIAW